MTSAEGDEDCAEEAATTTKGGLRPLRPSPPVRRLTDPNLRWEEEELAFQAEASPPRPPPASEGRTNDTATMVARMKHDGVFMICDVAISSRLGCFGIRTIAGLELPAAQEENLKE